MLIFLGALHWWIALALFFFAVLTLSEIRMQFRQILLIGFSFALVASAHIATYVFVYAGTGDTRHRAIMYVLLMPLLVCFATAAHIFRSSVPARHRSVTVGPNIETSPFRER